MKTKNENKCILAIETTGAFASVALLTTGPDPSHTGVDPAKAIDVIHGSDRFSHLQNLTPQISEILERNGFRIRDLDAIAVSNGPGSFTGIRIGVSTGRALSQVSGVPCIPVSGLEALAMRGEGRVDVMAQTATLVCPILDARRRQVYGGGYLLGAAERDGSGQAGDAGVSVPEEIVAAGPYLIDEFIEAIAGSDTQDGKTVGGCDRILFLGDGIDKCGEEIRAWAAEKNRSIAFAEEESRYQDARTVVLRARQMLEEGRACGYMELKPNYMRMAEAERKLRMQQAEKKK